MATKIHYKEIGIMLNAANEAAGGSRRVTIESIGNSNYGGSDVKFGINWAAIGTVSVAEAREFSDKLLKATAIANKLNAMGFEVDWEIEEPIADTGKTARDWYSERLAIVKEAIEADGFGKLGKAFGNI